jgi:UDP-N-acetylmuramoyl-tripeptide--D-alanyl-D-alanine ligase
MIRMTLGELAAVTGASLVGGPDGTVVDATVTTDSRECVPGSLYVARRGEHADGHDFATAAAAAGAVAVLGERPVEGVPTLVVADVQTAFGRVARAVVDRAPDLTIVGVTGSSGKTTVKDLLAAVLSTQAPTVAPVNSLNGEIGVPLTVCRVEQETRYLVAEMGARGIGHLDYLTTIAPPGVAVVLNVGLAHVGEFGSVDNIALAKSELPRAVPAGGVAVLNRDDPAVTAMAEGLECRVVMVGEHADADLRAADVTLDGRGRAAYTLVRRGVADVPVTLAQPGRHQVGNSLAVIAVALEVGVPLEQTLETLATAGPASRWRMEITDRADGATVVNDAYNANPDSTRAALRALADMTVPGRRVAVLGGMLELGAASQEQHLRTGGLAAELGVDVLLGVGDLARDVVSGYEEAGSSGSAHWVDDTDGAYDWLEAVLRPGDVVLLKSSRDAGLRWLGDRLAGVGPEADPAPSLRHNESAAPVDGTHGTPGPPSEERNSSA